MMRPIWRSSNVSGSPPLRMTSWIGRFIFQSMKKVFQPHLASKPHSSMGNVAESRSGNGSSTIQLRPIRIRPWYFQSKPISGILEDSPKGSRSNRVSGPIRRPGAKPAIRVDRADRRGAIRLRYGRGTQSGKSPDAGLARSAKLGRQIEQSAKFHRIADRACEFGLPIGRRRIFQSHRHYLILTQPFPFQQ